MVTGWVSEPDAVLYGVQYSSADCTMPIAISASSRFDWFSTADGSISTLIGANKGARMDGYEFEREVLRVARHLWRKDEGGGPELVDGRERDGVFYEDDVIHLVEATVERSEQKAKDDCRKLAKLASDLRKKHFDKVVKCWFVTRHEPTDRQRTVARSSNYPVQAIGFKEFQGKLVDAREYLAARKEHRFGSAHNPDESAHSLTFVPIDVKERASLELWSVGRIASELLAGRRIVLSADFGAGKSMVLRELFFDLARRYLDGGDHRFPVHINLREHSGAIYPDEILERHARAIGFSSPSKLVRAWRAGYAVLLLDGLDEITSLGFQGKWNKLREVRFRALLAVRTLVSEQPVSTGVIVAGREYYFDSYSELKTSLGLRSTLDLSLNDFSQDQIDELLRSLGVAGQQIAPAWLPKRPLFVATLALRGYLADLRGAQDSSIGAGWSHLVSSICERESRISMGLDSETIRRVLDRVATLSRCRPEGAGISQTELVQAFTDVCGYVPDEQGLLLLERLPGLGISAVNSEDRTFIDADFESALGAGDLARYYVEPWGEHETVKAVCRPLSEVGISVGVSMLHDDPRAKHGNPAFERAQGFGCLTFDVLQLSAALGARVSCSVAVSDVHATYLDVSGEWDANEAVYFSDCIFDTLDVDVQSNFACATRLQGCLVRTIEGARDNNELPANFLDERCVVEGFAEGASSNAQILDADMPLPLRVLVVVLRKLYVQAGSARKENAFYRGLDHNAQRYVGDILDILSSEGLASIDRRRGSDPVVVPNRSEMRRVARVISAPRASTDPLVVRVRGLAELSS